MTINFQEDKPVERVKTYLNAIWFLHRLQYTVLRYETHDVPTKHEKLLDRSGRAAITILGFPPLPG